MANYRRLWILFLIMSSCLLLVWTGILDIGSVSVGGEMADSARAAAPLVDLTLSARASHTWVTATAPITYTFTMTNTGPDNIATNVALADVIPPGALFESASSECAYRAFEHTIGCELGQLSVGEVASVTVTLLAPLNGGDLINSARITSSEQDFQHSNNLASVSVYVAPLSDLQVELEDLMDPVGRGQNFNFKILVNNLGPSDAPYVTVNHYLPTGMSYLTASASQGECGYDSNFHYIWCHIGYLLSHGSAEVQAMVAAPGLTGKVTNTAAVFSSALDPETTNNFAVQVTQVNQFTYRYLPITCVGSRLR